MKFDEETLCSKHFFIHVKVKITLLLNAVAAIHDVQLFAFAFVAFLILFKMSGSRSKKIRQLRCQI